MTPNLESFVMHFLAFGLEACCLLVLHASQTMNINIPVVMFMLLIFLGLTRLCGPHVLIMVTRLEVSLPYFLCCVVLECLLYLLIKQVNCVSQFTSICLVIYKL